ncbi:MAG: ATP-dependent RNA helicase HrpA [Desulfobacteraceae bacterium]|nr:ATP-dependent RNA helicase HrpA [Desulfobacteraceae bacterium]
MDRALHCDRHAVEREIRRIEKGTAGKKKPKDPAEILQRAEKRIDASIAVRKQRMDNLPEISANPDLPVWEKQDEITAAIAAHQVVIISGETGSGKTTQLPKFCLKAGRGLDGRIGCTQPRRIAAVTVADRIAEELGQQTGAGVGCKIRFSDRVSDRTVIKMMTDGVLLAETQGDKYLNEYDTLIVDEAHERSLNIDFLLGLLRGLVRTRPDLKVIVTSATIDTEKFSKAFGDAPIIEVSGRMYPVEVRWLPPADTGGEAGEYSYVDAAAAAMDRIEQESAFGDVLIFMPTERDIRETCEILEGRKYKNAVILPLYARLAAADQVRVFQPARGRKIVVATNVAETSITIPGIKYVIDTGLARVSHYHPVTRTTALPVSPISQSSADQRMGRCGRVQNGVCIRLYSEEDYLSRPVYTLPEILRANLAEVILRMISLRLGAIRDFPFVDAPPQKQIRDGFDILDELGAVEKPAKGKKGPAKMPRLTQKGRIMAKMPLDPRLSRMLIEADQNRCLGPVTVVAAALSVIDPRERPEGKEAQADQARAAFVDRASDFITLYNLFCACTQNSENIRPKVRAGELKRFCRDYYLSFKRMREWFDVYDQMVDLLAESGLQVRPLSGSGPENQEKKTGAKKGQPDFSDLYTAVHKSVTSGFLSNIARRREKNLYWAARQQEVMIFPGSGLFNRAGEWIVAAEIVETTRKFARTCANIDPAWLEALGGARCKYTHLNPRWEKKREAVVADEQVSLYGLIIVSARPVLYGRIDPDAAEEIFIRNALIEGDVQTVLPFMTHNWSLAEQIRDRENRIRRRELLAGEADMMAFYKDRLSGVYDMRTLKKKIRDAGSDDFLKMSEQDLMAADADTDELALYPDQIRLGGQRFFCEYAFNPGGDDDGVTIRVPASAAGRVPKQSTDWVVPGLLEEKITALIRNLPKKWRRQLVPVSETVSRIMSEMPMYRDSLAGSLSRFIYDTFHVDIPANAWSEAELPDHLRLRFSLVDPEGKELAAGRDRSVLSRGAAKEGLSDDLQEERQKWEKQGLTDWDLPDLPETVSVSGAGGQAWPVYPALVPGRNGADLRLLDNRSQAEQTHKNGVACLYAHYFAKSFKHLRRSLTLPASAKPMAVYFGGADAVADQMVQRVQAGLFAVNIRTRAQFYAHGEKNINRIMERGMEIQKAVLRVLETHHKTRQQIHGFETRHSKAGPAPGLLEQIRTRISQLVPENFIELYDTKTMGHLPRYLEALGLRAERGINDPDKEKAKAARLAGVENFLTELIRSLDESASAEKRQQVESFFWMIQEFAVSLFAQELKTAVPVSEKRLKQMYQQIRRMT